MGAGLGLTLTLCHPHPVSGCNSPPIRTDTRLSTRPFDLGKPQHLAGALHLAPTLSGAWGRDRCLGPQPIR